MFLDNLKFFKTPRHKQFTYRPRYYDEQKEDLQRRVQAAQQEVRGEKEYTREALRTRIDFRAQSKLGSRPDFMTNLRIVFIAGILVSVVYIIIKYL